MWPARIAAPPARIGHARAAFRFGSRRLARPQAEANAARRRGGGASVAARGPASAQARRPAQNRPGITR
ncbi:hypothetical protein DF122_07235 [Burkholderia pseudomallei]|nr:hypothetical protein BOC35_12660 [Burkholderia pseudomallei]EBA45300.1 hypothetical protein BURPS305_0972 [Burkholderia pseudomallei 305]PNX06648.1 hypothetical protein CF649_00300 [Burkholderia sp. 136(2017)]PNX15481.1 hypothetical protein CF650_13050 [Burkholderia sp. 129]PNX33887.1 hypothetical protein CF647_00210 [Burkholderia sp. 117]PNX42369.1 hypothetical protein CF648_00300 [Burkholderia sp. 137]